MSSGPPLKRLKQSTLNFRARQLDQGNVVVILIDIVFLCSLIIHHRLRGFDSKYTTPLGRSVTCF